MMDASEAETRALIEELRQAIAREKDAEIRQELVTQMRVLIETLGA